MAQGEGLGWSRHNIDPCRHAAPNVNHWKLSRPYQSWGSAPRSRRRKSTRFQRRKSTRSRRLFTDIDNMITSTTRTKSTAVSKSTALRPELNYSLSWITGTKGPQTPNRMREREREDKVWKSVCQPIFEWFPFLCRSWWAVFLPLFGHRRGGLAPMAQRRPAGTRTVHQQVGPWTCTSNEGNKGKLQNRPPMFTDCSILQKVSTYW